jgi:hypothetical protein
MPRIAPSEERPESAAASELDGKGNGTVAPSGEDREPGAVLHTADADRAPLRASGEEAVRESDERKITECTPAQAAVHLSG